jgi:hypothetical protein
MSASKESIVQGERVYDSVPDGLTDLWNHVRIEASMRSNLERVEAKLASLLETPKTYAEIEQGLQEIDEETRHGGLEDIFRSLFAVHVAPASKGLVTESNQVIE